MNGWNSAILHLSSRITATTTTTLFEIAIHYIHLLIDALSTNFVNRLLHGSHKANSSHNRAFIPVVHRQTNLHLIHIVGNDHYQVTLPIPYCSSQMCFIIAIHSTIPTHEEPIY